MSEIKFAVMPYKQEFLIIKDADKKPFVFAAIYLAENAELVKELLETHFNQQEKKDDDK